MNILATSAPHTRGKSGYFPVIHWRISDCIIDYIFHSAICTSGCPHTALTDSQHTMQKHNFLQTSSAQVGKFALWACIGSNLAGNKICYWNVLETLTTNVFPQQSILDKFKSIMCFLTAKTKPFFFNISKVYLNDCLWQRYLNIQLPNHAKIITSEFGMFTNCKI